MDLSFSPEEEAFRQEVKDFIADAKPKLPKNLGAPEQARLSKDDYMVWHKLLYQKGWVAPAWPKAIWRRRMERDAALYLLHRERQKPACPPPCRSAWAWWGR